MRYGGFTSVYRTSLLRFTVLRHIVTFQELIAQLLWLNHFESFVKRQFLYLLTIDQGVRTRAYNTNYFILWPRWCCAGRKAFLLSRRLVRFGKNGSTKDGIGDVASFFHKGWQISKRGALAVPMFNVRRSFYPLPLQLQWKLSHNWHHHVYRVKSRRLTQML